MRPGGSAGVRGVWQIIIVRIGMQKELKSLDR